jgi:hypothetical protein
LLHGIPVIVSETTERLLSYLDDLWNKVGVTERIVLDDAYRLGKPSTSGPRPVLIKFLRMIDKKKILSKRKDIAKLKVYINEDCLALKQFQKKLLNTHLKAFKDMDDTVWGSIRGNSLHVKKQGQLTRKFTVEDGTVKEILP